MSEVGELGLQVAIKKHRPMVDDLVEFEQGLTQDAAAFKLSGAVIELSRQLRSESVEVSGVSCFHSRSSKVWPLFRTKVLHRKRWDFASRLVLGVIFLDPRVQFAQSLVLVAAAAEFTTPEQQ